MINYKKLIKSRSVRHKILKVLSFIPDKTMVKIQYWIKLGRWPDLKNPKLYTEKMQLYKVYYRNPVLGVCCDKFKVREYLEQKGLGEHLGRLYGSYERAEDIDFDALPDKFVLKTNDGSGGNNVIICTDKSKLNIPEVRQTLNSWLNIKNINPGREWCYTMIPKSVIMAEEFLEDLKRPGQSIDDFKFYCFAGEIFCIQHDAKRYTPLHTRTFYDADWNKLPTEMLAKAMESPEPLPENFEQMKRLARRLSEDFPHVRVDLYSVNGKVYFGELTFYPGAGYNKVEPSDFDLRMGEAFDISSFMPEGK